MKIEMLVNTTTNIFGEKANLDLSLEKFNIVIIAYNKGYGLIPCYLCLSHQVYTKTLNKLLEKNPGIESFTIIPANSKIYIDIAEVIDEN